jgi:hypothetical protein
VSLNLTTIFNQNPIFIGGPDRCGKTTLQAFLSSHPNIAIPAVGSNFWTYFYGQYGNLSRPENFDRCLAAMLHYKHALYLKPDPVRIRREFWMGEPSYDRLFSLFHQHFAEREGKPRWGDQTGLVERYADPIFAAYRRAKMIHMVRDPRDRYEASLAMWPNGKGKVGGATARWFYSVYWARRNLKRYPDRYMIVHYEALVRQPELVLRNVCAFLEEEYLPSMLNMDGSVGHREKLRQAGSPPSSPAFLTTDFIGRYRETVPKTEIAFMQSLARPQMTYFGYKPDALKFSPKERVHFTFVDLPLNLLRMGSWLAQELIQHRFPGHWGRKPSAHMIVGPRRPGNSRVKTI